MLARDWEKGPSVSTHMSICSLRDLKSRPGARRVFRHLSPKPSTSTPILLYQILLWFLSCGSILESNGTSQLSLPFLENKKQPHHQFFPVCVQTVDRHQLGLLQDFFSLSVPFYLGTLHTCSPTDMPVGSWRLYMNRTCLGIPNPLCDGSASVSCPWVSAVNHRIV